MKTEEILYNFLKTRLDEGNSVVFNPVADKASFDLLAAKDETDNPIILRFTKQVIDELSERFRRVDAALTLTLPSGYIAIPVNFITAIILAAYLRGIEMGRACGETDELEKLFSLE